MNEVDITKKDMKHAKKTAVNEEAVHNGYVIGAFGIIFLISAMIIMFWAPATIVASFNLYHRWLESIAWITGFGSILYAFGFVFHGSSRQKISSVLFAIAAIIGLFLVMYIDFLRPELVIPGIFNDVGQFDAFKLNIAFLEASMILLSFVGMIVTKVRLNR
ncbi:MAG TPA: hypothetical protein VKM55_06505 [Candidatus Lokiarchaeia archaeon]|nr:hypothetical protein [Candidatus Lokiarchaeia archaeon]